MSRRRRVVGRVVVLCVLLAVSTSVGVAFLDRGTGDGTATTPEPGTTVAEPRPGITVVTTQGLIPTVEAPQAAISPPNGMLVAVGASGDVVYRNTTYHSYWDVDPVPGTRATVSYVASEYVPSETCGSGSPCYRRHVERVNLSTGVVERIHTDTAPQGRWHDVDRIGAERLLVADISVDHVRVVNTTTGLTTWAWDVTEGFAPTSGGSFGGDWAHLNDVERLPDGRYMASLRNQDAVVFLDPDEGLQANWTLGGDDERSVLFEQHNPDYVPAERGGPAVIVADSENDRIVEYQRVNGSWEQSWVWQDARMDWPRDADRLPNGHTLITDTGSDRVLEIAPNGSVVWSMRLQRPYEAERLGTGDESAGGRAASALGLTSRTVADEPGGSPGVVAQARGAVGFLAPPWLGFWHVVSLAASLLVGLVWLAAEAYWSAWTVRVRWPVEIGRR